MPQIKINISIDCNGETIQKLENIFRNYYEKEGKSGLFIELEKLFEDKEIKPTSINLDYPNYTMEATLCGFLYRYD